MSLVTSEYTRPGLLPPLSMTSSNNQFNDYVNDLFRAALHADKKLSRDRLKDPDFGSRILEKCPDKSAKTSRIVLLNLLARDHVGDFQGKEIQSLIHHVGRSTYVASCSENDVGSLYERLFSYPQCQSFSRKDLLDFEGNAKSALHGHIFVNILNHKMFANLTIMTINELAQHYIKFIPLPHIHYLIQIINRSDSCTERKVEALGWSFFSYPESHSLSREELIGLLDITNKDLHPHILNWMLKHPSFKGASTEELDFLTDALEEADCSRDLKIEFLSNLLKSH